MPKQVADLRDAANASAGASYDLVLVSGQLYAGAGTAEQLPRRLLGLCAPGCRAMLTYWGHSGLPVRLWPLGFPLGDRFLEDMRQLGFLLTDFSLCSRRGHVHPLSGYACVEFELLPPALRPEPPPWDGT
ncbi:unnamed protein product [Prorocentrum cordatum]|uniref:Uncharacterized protein n=1 Tax=Prorocentrum cordatum TaxID=2364126 RepID=A0ABN9UKH5_9DINO|nr:unnamed protein product [Polarella glacialis]